MSTTDIIKPLLDRVFGEADWKRLSKSKINSFWELREFKEPKSGVVVVAYTHIESQMTQLYNGSKIIFGIAQDGDDLVVRVAEPFYERSNEQSELLEAIFGFIGKNIPAYLRHATGDLYVCHAGLHSRDQLVADLVTGGFTFDIGIANDLNEDYGGPVYGHVALGQAIAEVEAAEESEDEGDPYHDGLEARWGAAKGKLLFGVYWDSKHTDDGSMAVSFAEPTQWAKDGYIESIHAHDILLKLGYTLPAYLPGEDQENTFVVWEDGMDYNHMAPINVTRQQVIDDLTAAGFVFSKELDDMLNS